MTDFLSYSTPAHIDAGRYTWQVPDGWQQGRGAFGGLVLAGLIRAFENEVAAGDQELRAVSATLCGPLLAEEADIRVEELRAGSNTTTLAARITQPDGLKAHASALFGRRRVEDGDWNTFEAPEFGDWRAVDVVELQPPMAPTFTSHMEFRPLEGTPFSGGTEREVVGWVRLREPGLHRDAALLGALMDAHWPAAFATTDRMRPMATVTFSMQFPGSFEGLDADAPVFYRGRCPVSRDGYMVEFRELWGEDGRLLGLNQQTMCIIK